VEPLRLADFEVNSVTGLCPTAAPALLVAAVASHRDGVLPQVVRFLASGSNGLVYLARPSHDGAFWLARLAQAFDAGGLSFDAVIDCRWLSILGDLHRNLAVVAVDVCQIDRVDFG
jgi:hypothetical protein